MFNVKAVALVVAILAPACSASAQGTKENPTKPVTSSAGAPVSSSRDSMGGAFTGTGTPTFGTSPGMGSDTSNRRPK